MFFIFVEIKFVFKMFIMENIEEILVLIEEIDNL